MIDLMRHGECVGGDIFRGISDCKLTDTGWNTMQCAINQLSECASWEQIITSPLQRCSLFAKSLHKKRNIPIKVENDFRELDFGDWEGMSIQTIWDNEKNKIESLYNNPANFIAPNGESMHAFKHRVISAWRKMLTAFSGKHVLLIQHGGTIRILMTYLLSTPMESMIRFHVPYGCVIRFHIDHDDQNKPSLIFYNPVNNIHDK